MSEIGIDETIYAYLIKEVSKKINEQRQRVMPVMLSNGWENRLAQEEVKIKKEMDKVINTCLAKQEQVDRIGCLAMVFLCINVETIRNYLLKKLKDISDIKQKLGEDWENKLKEEEGKKRKEVDACFDNKLRSSRISSLKLIFDRIEEEIVRDFLLRYLRNVSDIKQRLGEDWENKIKKPL